MYLQQPVEKNNTAEASTARTDMCLIVLEDDIAANIGSGFGQLGIYLCVQFD